MSRLSDELTGEAVSAPAAYTAHSSGATPVTSNAATDLDTTAAAVQGIRASLTNLILSLREAEIIKS